MIKSIQSFVEDSALDHIAFYPKNYDEEVFLHQLAAVLRLRRESVVTNNALKSNCKNVKINLWKPALYPCSTTKKAADMNIGPLGSPEDNLYNDEYNLYNGEEGDVKSSGSDQNDTSPIVKVTVDYYITPTGRFDMKFSVDASKMVVVLPRIGIQFNINDKFLQVMWRGMGPHECYPDRKESNINAVHIAPIDALHVPYIVPSENGNRTDIDWVQLDQHISYDMSPLMSVNPITNKKSSKSLASIQSDVQSDDDLKTLPEKTTIQLKNLKLFSLKISSGNDPFNFSAQPFTTEDLSRASNMTFLHKSARPFYTINVDRYYYHYYYYYYYYYY